MTVSNVVVFYRIKDGSSIIFLGLFVDAMPLNQQAPPYSCGSSSAGRSLSSEERPSRHRSGRGQAGEPRLCHGTPLVRHEQLFYQPGMTDDEQRRGCIKQEDKVSTCTNVLEMKSSWCICFLHVSAMPSAGAGSDRVVEKHSKVSSGSLLSPQEGQKFIFKQLFI